MKEICINKKIIKRDSSDIYLIAEIGTNFVEMDVELEKIIKKLKKLGVHAIKFQAYTASKIAQKKHPAYDYFKKHSFDISFWEKIADICDSVDIDFILSFFDEEYLHALYNRVAVIKIASTDINNKRLIHNSSLLNKPIIISTGASKKSEIIKAKQWAKFNTAFLHCVSSYPTETKDLNLGAIKDMMEFLPFNVIGYSDHSKNINNIFTAYVMGANIIEKHFTIDKNLKGNDHEHSMDYNDIKVFFEKVESFKEVYGKGIKEPVYSEIDEIKYGRRYLVFNKKKKYGEIITDKDIKTLKITQKDLKKKDILTADKIDEVVGKKYINIYPSSFIGE